MGLKKNITEEVLELRNLAPEVCKKFKGTKVEDGRCVVRLETKEGNPDEAKLRSVDFKSTGKNRFKNQG